MHNSISKYRSSAQKGSGSTKNGRDSLSKRRGVKVFGDQTVVSGGIILRQVGSKFHAGINVGSGKDYTLFALTEGIVKFERLRGRNVCRFIPPKVLEKEFSFSFSTTISSSIPRSD